MGLFTDPVTLDTDRIFNYKGQEYDKRSAVGVYYEPAADIAAQSELVIKHDENGSVPRHLFQRSIMRVPAAAADGVLRRITVNVTVVADSLFTETEVQDEVDISVSGIAQTGFVKSLLQGAL